jgi:hypothetical protein
MKPTKASAEPAHHYTPEEMHNEDVAHEHVDVNISALVWSMVIMFGTVIGTAVLMYGLFWGVLEPQAAARDPKLSPLAMPSTAMPPTTTASPFFGGAPEPKLMTDEPKRLNEVRTSEQSLLHAYGWTDEKAGVAHIPIDEAKKLMIERGLAVRPDPLTDERLGTRRPASGESSSGRNVTRTLAPAAASAPVPAPAPAAHEGHK